MGEEGENISLNPQFMSSNYNECEVEYVNGNCDTFWGEYQYTCAQSEYWGN